MMLQLYCVTVRWNQRKRFTSIWANYNLPTYGLAEI